MRCLTFTGRLAKTAMDMFEQIGIQCEEMKDEKTRKLIFVNEELKLRAATLEPSDVEYRTRMVWPTRVKDTILEEDRKCLKYLDFFEKCRMCV